MGFPWRQVISAAAGGGVALIPGVAPFSPLIMGTLNAALKENDADDLERWGKDIEELAKNGRIDSDKGRAMVMRGKIRYDTYKRTGKMPSEAEVRWLLETLVMTYYGTTIDDLDSVSEAEKDS